MTPSKVWNWPVAIALLDRHRTVPKPPEEADQQHRTMTKAAEPASSAKEENTQNLRFSPDIRKNRSRQKQKKKTHHFPCVVLLLLLLLLVVLVQVAPLLSRSGTSNKFSSWLPEVSRSRFTIPILFPVTKNTLFHKNVIPTEANPPEEEEKLKQTQIDTSRKTLCAEFHFSFRAAAATSPLFEHTKKTPIFHTPQLLGRSFCPILGPRTGIF